MNLKNIWKPKVFSEGKKVKELLNTNKIISYIDVFDRQLKELFFIDNLKYIGQEKSTVYKSSEFKKYKILKKNSYKYIYYPWNNSVVKCVLEDDYFRLKTNRNQDLITPDEQKKLYETKVAVFGMSVGSNIAFVLTQSGVSKNIIIADFDELDTTNLNRIWAGVHQVGLNKAVIAARRIYEDNPYANITCLTEGITKEKLEILLNKKKINYIIEEIDQMEMKIEIRRLAIKHKVPVLMITDNGDRVVLMVERYDLGYKKIFNKSVEYWAKRLQNFSGQGDFADIVINQIVGGADKVDPRMMMSAKKVMVRKLVSWPQLGSAALLGGITTTIALKSILRNEDKKLFRREYITILD